MRASCSSLSQFPDFPITNFQSPLSVCAQEQVEEWADQFAAAMEMDRLVAVQAERGPAWAATVRVVEEDRDDCACAAAVQAARRNAEPCIGQSGNRETGNGKTLPDFPITNFPISTSSSWRGRRDSNPRPPA